MNTDKQLFLLFQACPEWLFDLADLKSPGASEMRSFTVKALERRTDGLIVPDNLKEPLTVAEFQFSWDDAIYRRVVSEMIAAQDAFHGRDVRGLIVFGSRRCDPKTEPWTQIVQTIFIDEAVESLRKRNSRHPLTAVLHPVVESRPDVLESTAAESFRTINSCSVSQSRKDILATVFMDWLAQRLPGKSPEEIKAMLFDQLTPLEETRYYKDLVRIGEAQGEAAAIWRFVAARFPAAPRSWTGRIERLSSDQRHRLLDLVATCESLTELRAWFRDAAK